MSKPLGRRIRTTLRPHLFTIVFIVILTVAASLSTLVLPLVGRQIVNVVILRDKLGLDGKSRQILLLGLLGIACLSINELLTIVQQRRTQVLNLKLALHWRRQLFYHALRLPMETLGQLKTGGIASRLSSDIDQLANVVERVLVIPVSSLTVMIGTLSFVFSINWRLAIGCFAVVPPVALATYFLIRHTQPLYHSIQRIQQELNSLVVETFQGIRVIRVYGMHKKVELNFARRNHELGRKNLYSANITIAAAAGGRVVVALSSLVIIVWGGLLVTRGAATLGDILAFQMYTLMLLNPVFMMSTSVAQAQQGLVAIERVFEIVDAPTNKPDLATSIVTQPISSFELRDVCFGYSSDNPVIKQVNLSVEGDRVISIVGRSGAGKTTLIDLIARIYDPTSGAILVNGVDIRSYKLESYRQLFGIVDQDSFLFDGTIRENIECGRRQVTHDYITAAKFAHLQDYVASLKDGYNTRVGERGVMLSGGQRQRVCIARAFFANPAILILDEATSNLDTETESQIQAALSILMRRRLTVIIAHRLSTVKQSDLILVLDRGSIIESGTHDSLLQANGSYSDMIRRQSL